MTIADAIPTVCVPPAITRLGAPTPAVGAVGRIDPGPAVANNDVAGVTTARAPDVGNRLPFAIGDRETFGVSDEGRAGGGSRTTRTLGASPPSSTAMFVVSVGTGAGAGVGRAGATSLATDGVGVVGVRSTDGTEGGRLEPVVDLGVVRPGNARWACGSGATGAVGTGSATGVERGAGAVGCGRGIGVAVGAERTGGAAGTGVGRGAGAGFAAGGTGATEGPTRGGARPAP